MREGGKCPFCAMKAALERSALEFVMGPSYMERDVRAETDRTGFCARHAEKMLKAKNVLGVALMLQTRLLKTRRELSGGVFKKKGKGDEPPKETCYVCAKIDNTFERYVDTFFVLYAREEEIRRLAEGGKGFCLPHFDMLIRRGANSLNAKTYADFAKTITAVQEKNMDRLLEEMEWFVQKFDYRFKDEPWNNSKDAPQRAALKLCSFFNEEEKNG